MPITATTNMMTTNMLSPQYSTTTTTESMRNSAPPMMINNRDAKDVRQSLLPIFSQSQIPELKFVKRNMVQVPARQIQNPHFDVKIPTDCHAVYDCPLYLDEQEAPQDCLECTITKLPIGDGRWRETRTYLLPNGQTKVMSNDY